MIEPDCQASLLAWTERTRDDKGLLLFSNPANSKERVNMTVRLSYDEGKTWAASKQIYPGPSAYSCLVVLPEMTIGCLYERGNKSAYEKISFVRFPLVWLTDGIGHVESQKE